MIKVIALLLGIAVGVLGITSVVLVQSANSAKQDSRLTQKPRGIPARDPARSAAERVTSRRPTIPTGLALDDGLPPRQACGAISAGVGPGGQSVVLRSRIGVAP